MDKLHGTWYWVFPQEGDPLPSSGFRRIFVKTVGRKWVSYLDPHTFIGHKILLAEWERIPHVEDHGQPLAAVLNTLRPFTSREL